MDDERLKNPPGRGHTDYFDELLERIGDIRASERRFYQKVLDIYATSVDYQLDTELAAVLRDRPERDALGHARAHGCRERPRARRRRETLMGMQTTWPAVDHGVTLPTRWSTAVSHGVTFYVLGGRPARENASPHPRSALAAASAAHRAP